MNKLNFKLAAPVLVTLIGFFLSSCGGSTKSSSSLNDTVNNMGSDVTVLQAWLGKGAGLKLNSYTGSDYPLNPSDCQEIRRDTRTGSDGREYSYVEADCARAIESAAKLSGQDSTSPMINKAIHAYYDEPSRNSRYSNTGMCEIVEFRTVTPESVLAAPSFKGISFYFSRGGAEIVRKDALHRVGSVTLKDGTPAAVHRFIAQGMCFGTGGNGGTIADRQYKFRPFAQFGADGNDYNVWDNVEKDYLLGRDRDNHSPYVFVKDFNRESELLRQ